MLNTTTEHDFMDELKKWQSVGNSAYMQTGSALRVVVASSPEVSF
jgi:hypothetical protein